MKFMNLPKEFRSKDSKTFILPLSFKTKTTRDTNCFRGPKEIINASKEVEYYDCDLDFEAYERGIYQEDILEISETCFKKVFHNILDKTKKIYDPNNFLVVLGSDHSTTIPVIEAISTKEKDFGIIVFDAHADLREPWGEDTWWHASTSRLISKDHKTFILGARSLDFYEKEFLESSENLDLIKAKEIVNKENYFDFYKSQKFLNLLKKLPKKVYVSFDVDVFDPSIMSAVATPEPGGLNWYQVTNILETIFREKEVIGFDLTEYSPKQNDFNNAYLLAKLVYRVIGYKHKFNEL